MVKAASEKESSWQRPTFEGLERIMHTENGDIS